MSETELEMIKRDFDQIFYLLRVAQMHFVDPERDCDLDALLRAAMNRSAEAHKNLMKRHEKEGVA